MEHIIITDIGSGYYHLTPDEGYTLYNIRTNTYHSDAETKNLSEWTAVKKAYKAWLYKNKVVTLPYDT